MYNINDNQAVKMESYLDNNDDNHWKKVSELVDDGGWYARSSNDEFYSANCNTDIVWQFLVLNVILKPQVTKH
jgi:hypothetical protein